MCLLLLTCSAVCWSVHSSLCYCFSFFFQCPGAPRDLHSFPTRRSSDLTRSRRPWMRRTTICRSERAALLVQNGRSRSEDHTSELQSRQYLVCRLLLEKKKETKNTQTADTRNPTVTTHSRACTGRAQRRR